MRKEFTVYLDQRKRSLLNTLVCAWDSHSDDPEIIETLEEIETLIDFLHDYNLRDGSYTTRLKSECLETMKILASDANNIEYLKKIEILENKYHEAKSKLLEVNKEIDDIIREWGNKR